MRVEENKEVAPYRGGFVKSHTMLRRDDIHSSPKHLSFRPPLPYWASYYCGKGGYHSQETGYYNNNTGKFETISRQYLLQPPGWMQMGVPLSVNGPVTLKSDVYAIAAQRADDNLRQKIWNLTETLADADKALGSVYDLLRRILLPLIKMASGNYKGALRDLGLTGKSLKQALKSPASSYLAYIYAIKPLVSDVKSGVDMYRNGANIAPRIHGRARSQQTVSVTNGKGSNVLTCASPDGSGHYWGITLPTSWSQTREEFATVRVDYEVVDLSMAFASLSGATDPFSILWARNPLTFVIDWAIDIGGFIRQFQPLFGLNCLGVSVTRGVKLRFSGNAGSAVCSGKCVYFSRTVSTVAPIFWKPNWGRGLNSGKIISLIAMAVSKTERRQRSNF